MKVRIKLIITLVVVSLFSMQVIYGNQQKQPQKSFLMDNVTCSTFIDLGPGMWGLPDEICLQYDLTCYCDGNGNFVVTGTVNFLDCASGSVLSRIPFTATTSFEPTQVVAESDLRNFLNWDYATIIDGSMIVFYPNVPSLVDIEGVGSFNLSYLTEIIAMDELADCLRQLAENC